MAHTDDAYNKKPRIKSAAILWYTISFRIALFSTSVFDKCQLQIYISDVWQFRSHIDMSILSCVCSPHQC